MRAHGFLWVGLVVATLVACGGGDPKKKGECEAGEVDACVCTDGGSGERTCGGDLTFGACDCAPECAEDADCDGDGARCVDGACSSAPTDDTDGDGVPDVSDNCPQVANADQADADQDGVGDACEIPGDDDADGILDADDNCPSDANADQADRDADGVGDVCDPDRDGDGVTNGTDNCPNVRNPTQTDTNGDGIGDACDGDFDGIVDELDNCPSVQNAGQDDLDADGLGDACDLDVDGDGVLDVDDNCVAASNPDQLDTDADGDGDACDDDDDGDGLRDDADNCPLVVNPAQNDRDGNQIGDACDDSDGDGVVDAVDNCPDEANPQQTFVDTDGDGLQDCDERTLGTNPQVADTDGDGLTDQEEVGVHSTNPLVPDTDADGLSDGDEIRFGLDPTNPSTFNDGVLDGDRPWIAGCMSNNPASSSSYTNSTGGWRHVMPAAVSASQNIQITGANAQNGWAASVFRTATGDVTGFVLRWTGPNNLGTTAATLGLGIDPRWRYYTSHEGDDVVMTRAFRRTFSGALDDLRNTLLDGLAPWLLADMTNLPASAPTTISAAVGYVSVTRGGGQTTIAAAFSDAAAPRFDLMEDLVNTTGIAASSSLLVDGCTPWSPSASDPALDLYWVLDQSGSMTDDHNVLKNNIGLVFSTLGNAHADVRMGVTNMDEAGNGRLRVPPAWHSDVASFTTEVDDYVIACTGCGPTSGYAEHGIDSAMDGITFMRSGAAPLAEQMRPTAAVVTIFMTDEEDQTFQDDPLTGASGRMKLAAFESFFATETTVFALTADGLNNCGSSDGQGYRALARVSGGMDVSLCQQSGAVWVDIATEAAGAASRYRLPSTPVSSSLRVQVGATEVPRSRTDGYEYFPASGTIAFFGTHRPGPTDPVLVHYQTF